MFKSWLGGGTQPKHSASSQSLSALDEPHALDEALEAMDRLMDDDITGAEKLLENGSSNFHKLANGVISFLRASLGFEAEIMKEASDRLADAEASAERERKRAIRENRHRSSFAPGVEFALCHAEAQLMSAVVGVLSESVVESVKSFYRLRTAYKTLEGIHASLQIRAEEQRVVGQNNPSAASSKVSVGGGSTASGKAGSVSKSLNHDEKLSEFVYSGVNLCFGLLLLILSMMPPSLGKVMAIVGFRGDRPRGIELLWKASGANNVHGAIAALVCLNYFGNAVQFCDILPDDDEDAGYPRKRCQDVLNRVRKRYPNSALWLLEEARMEAVDGRLDIAVEMLSKPINTQMRQVEALILFEKSLNMMYLHRYEETSKAFLKLCTLNSWSPGLYHYFAAVCNIELYRKARGLDEKEAERFAKDAEELLEKVPTLMGKKRFLAQGLPLELFAERKIKKWQARAKENQVRLVDGVGVSPYEEMIYFWCGHKKMPREHHDISYDSIMWTNDSQKNIDEQAIRWLLVSVIHRNRNEMPEALEGLQKANALDRNALKGLNHDEWMAPAVLYENAVCLWKEAGSKDTPSIKALLEKAANWGPYELDARIGLRVQTALDTINRISDSQESSS